MDKQIEMNKYIEKMFDAVEVTVKIEMLHRSLRKDIGSCKDLAVSSSFARDYGINRGSLLSSVLEHYHQLRLKDDKD